jgi:hypothetical protein
MSKFKGSFEQLEDTVTKMGCEGTWTNIPNGKQFNTGDGGILTWSPATGRIHFQGAAAAKARLQGLFFSAALPIHTTTPAAVDVPSRNPREKALLVHGQDAASREQFELVLQ